MPGRPPIYTIGIKVREQTRDDQPNFNQMHEVGTWSAEVKKRLSETNSLSANVYEDDEMYNKSRVLLFPGIAQIFKFADKRDALLDGQVDHVVDISLKLVELGGLHGPDLL